MNNLLWRFCLHWETAATDNSVCKPLERMTKVQTVSLSFLVNHNHSLLKLELIKNPTKMAKKPQPKNRNTNQLNRKQPNKMTTKTNQPKNSEWKNKFPLKKKKKKK